MGLGIKTAIKKAAISLRKKELYPIEHPVDSAQFLKDKTALIAGGSGGIGMAIAKSFLDSGANVVIGGTSDDKLRTCSAALGGERVGTVRMDLTDVGDAKEAVSKAVGIFGPINIFVCCAGVHTENVDFWTMNPAEFDRVMSVNLRGVFFVCQAMAKAMIESQLAGHILLVNSSRGFEPAWSPYGVSKWGLRGLTQGLAQTLLPYGITVNGIAPGSTATKLIGVESGDSITSDENGVGRLATPSEIASWAKMLVGPTGDMVVGETILVSGGRGCIEIR